MVDSISISPPKKSGDIQRTVVLEDVGDVEFDQLQKIHKALTSSAREHARRYAQHFRLSFDDIEMLDFRIRQSIKEFHVAQVSCSVNIFFADDKKEQFKSFEEFKSQQQAYPGCTEGLLLEYKFLCIHPETTQAHTYELSVRLNSRLGVEKRIRRASSGPESRFLKLFVDSYTAYVSVKYHNFFVAHSIADVIEKWLKECPASKESAILTILRTYARQLSTVLRYIIGLLAVYATWLVVPDVLSDDNNLVTLARLLVGGFACIYVSYRLAFHVGAAIASELEDYRPLSYIELTRGDKTEIGAAETRRTRSMLVGVATLAVALMQGLFTKVTVGLLLSVISKH